MEDIEKKPKTKTKKVVESEATIVGEVKDEVKEEVKEEVTVKPKKAREYVMTPARAAALERMKAARLNKNAQINETKTKQKELVDALLSKKSEEETVEVQKKVKKNKKQVIVIDEDSSSEEENQIVIRRKRAKAKPEVVKEVSQEPLPFILRRLR